MNTIEACGVKGMKSTPWRKSFKDEAAMLRWVDEHDAEVYATRPLAPQFDTETAAFDRAAAKRTER